MLRALCHELVALALAYGPRGFRPRTHKPHPPAEDETHRLWYLIEDHGDIVFPLLALIVLALIAFGIRKGMKSNTAELAQKEEQKDTIVRMMRSKLMVSPDAVAGELHIDRFRASALLDELVREGKLVEQRMVGGVANYRLKGL
ncbi:MAG TPA: hypothetical protein VLW85_12465 [Myxococcales bacterium]|nr:hypothetical protein [Myxococcales bacterium]